ncbi:ABC transporter ATP-binding protein [Candidatus Beckwithbacteria bacterium]|nr:ABC transporter ATP-binding protein [Candidatus Beckwithbacteria bacterium]
MASKKAILQIKNISKFYELDGITVKALEDVSLEIYKNDFAAIIGPSGSGKSTLMHLIGALDTPTKGVIKIEGKDIASMTETQLARIRNEKIGFVFQQFNLLAKTSALENVALPLLYTGNMSQGQRLEKAKHMLEKVGLGDRLKNHPNQLSGGQQQRVAIARALINNPSILLADEPTGNLDTKTGKDVMTMLKQLNKDGQTIILVTHDMSVAKQARRQIMIKDGEIVKRL